MLIEDRLSSAVRARSARPLAKPMPRISAVTIVFSAGRRGSFIALERIRREGGGVHGSFDLEVYEQAVPPRRRQDGHRACIGFLPRRGNPAL